MARAAGDSIAAALGAMPESQLQDSIYHYLNKRVNFSGQHTAFSQTSGKEVLEGEPSSQAAINQTLVAMLRAADIDAHPVLISTRKSGKINMDFPSFYQFNGLMIRSQIGKKSYLMDAGFPHSQPGLIPVDTYGSRGLVLKKDGYEWIDINPDKSLFDIQVQIDGRLERNGTLSGTVESLQQGYPAQIIRQQKADGMSDSEILRQTLFDGYPRMSVSNVEVNNAQKYGRPIVLSADFEIENYATSFTDGLNFSPMVVGYRNENPFSGPDRNLPITLDAPEKLELSYSIELPQGYSVAVDDDRTIMFSGAEFVERYDHTTGQLNYRYQINIDQRNFSADYFPSLYKLYNRWVELSNSPWLVEE
jgi:hypothetical protein